MMRAVSGYSRCPDYISVAVLDYTSLSGSDRIRRKDTRSR